MLAFGRPAAMEWPPSPGGDAMKWLLGLFVFITPVFAQLDTGTIVGTLLDASGAAVGSATVTFTSKATNAEWKVETDDKGEYVSPPPRAGAHTGGRGGLRDRDLHVQGYQRRVEGRDRRQGRVRLAAAARRDLHGARGGQRLQITDQGKRDPAGPGPHAGGLRHGHRRGHRERPGQRRSRLDSDGNLFARAGDQLPADHRPAAQRTRL